MANATCAFCSEEIDDRPIPPEILAVVGDLSSSAYSLHTLCAVRMGVGSLGHQLGLCSCPGKPGLLDDPPGLTPRQAAITAAAFYGRRFGLQVPVDGCDAHREEEEAADEPG